jgi:hypothetical protein
VPLRTTIPAETIQRTLALCAGSIIFRVQLMLPEAQHPQVQTVVEQEIGAVCRTLWPKFDLDR